LFRFRQLPFFVYDSESSADAKIVPSLAKTASGPKTLGF
jgi:hypothetical protein